MKSSKVENCELETAEVRTKIVTLRSWTSFADAFRAAATSISPRDHLQDVKVSHSADRGYEVRLYILKGFIK